MKKKKQSALKKYLESVSLVDWYLLIFMVILTAQTSYNLFYHEMQGNTHLLDGVLRTTYAGLFGYFMGNGLSTATINQTQKNLNKNIPLSDREKDNLNAENKNSKDSSVSSVAEENNLYLISEILTDDSDDLIIANKEVNRMRANIQIIIVGTIGIVSLLVLIFTRNLDVGGDQKIASLSQLRDFVSGSTGFLISNSKKR